MLLFQICIPCILPGKAVKTPFAYKAWQTIIQTILCDLRHTVGIDRPLKEQSKTLKYEIKEGVKDVELSAQIPL